MRRETLLPEEQLVAVVTAIYADADEQNWDTASLGTRTRMYTAWVDDPRVGGILTKYMSPEQARSWIKDGPMKEYSRASRGAGRYARFGRQGGTGPADVARVALGDNASVIAGSDGVKPLHCLAEVPDGPVTYIAWGEAKNFRNIVWAALRASVENNLTAHIVVTEPPGRVTPSEDVKTQQAIADRCGLTLHHMRETFGDRATGATS